MSLPNYLKTVFLYIDMKPLKKANILLVEDEEFLIETFEASLTHAGYNVFAAKIHMMPLKL